MLGAIPGLVSGLAHAGIERPISLGTFDIKRSQPTDQNVRPAGAALDRIRQNRGEFGGFMGAELMRRFAEGVARSGLGAEFGIESLREMTQLRVVNGPGVAI